MPRAFTAPRPTSYAPLPTPVRARDVAMPLPPGPGRGLPGVERRVARRDDG
ncbi:MAG: hypothetical protein ACNA8R_12025 [Nitriliruptoraceae bacterium]